MNTTEQKQALKQCQVFSSIDDAALETVLANLTEKQFDAGATAFREGEPATELLIVQDGKIALQMTTSSPETGLSRRITVEVVGANEIAGWSAVVEPHRYTMTGVSLQNTRALSISAVQLRQVMVANPSIGYDILTGLTKVIATRLGDTRQVLVSERLPVTDYGN